ncbi:MAG: NAD-dependent epimerase/dehydratase family protein [Candidatus Micrarchaeota archaeon]|nr:NAD-dependent epimerase/dehydratase family protein [Candidatus Micrarchaeota archaeon]
MYLVTGATGRVGRRLVSELIERRLPVRALIRKEEDALLLPKGVQPAVGDLERPETLRTAANGADVVFHLAALVGSNHPFGRLVGVNAIGTRNLLSACEGHAKIFVHCSSISVLGEIREPPATEETPTRPTTPYGKSKLMAEGEVWKFEGKVPFCIVRPSVAYGPGFTEGYFSLFSLLEKGWMPILGSGENRIPFVHSSDVVDALLLCAGSKAARNQIFMVSGKENLSQRGILSIATRELGVKEPRFSVPLPIAYLVAGGAQFAYSIMGKKSPITSEYVHRLARDRPVDIGKARRLLGYAPTVGLEQGIKEMVEQYRERKERDKEQEQ